MITKTTWTNIKGFIDAFNANYFQIEETSFYDIWLNVGGRKVQCIINKTSPASADQTDYQDNYKSSANTDNITTVSTLEEVYNPKIFSSTTDISLTASQETTLIDESYKGKLDELMIRVQDNNTEVTLEIDGVEVYRLNMGDLSDDYRLINSNEKLLKLFVTSDGKQFIDNYSVPVDFATGIKVKVKNLNGSTKKVYSYLIRTRKNT